MPANNQTFSKSQVRSRLRSAIREHSQRGGVSLRAISPMHHFPPVSILTAHDPEYRAQYAGMSDHAIARVNLISQLLEDEEYRAHNRIWHIAIVKGNEITQAKVVTVHIGNDIASPVPMVSFGEGWLHDGNGIVIPEVFTEGALNMEQALLRNQSRNANRNRSRSLSPSDSEQDDF